MVIWRDVSAAVTHVKNGDMALRRATSRYVAMGRTVCPLRVYHPPARGLETRAAHVSRRGARKKIRRDASRCAACRVEEHSQPAARSVHQHQHTAGIAYAREADVEEVLEIIDRTAPADP